MTEWYTLSYRNETESADVRRFGELRWYHGDRSSLLRHAVRTFLYVRKVIKDYTKVDEKKIKSAGVAGVVRPSQKDVQVIIGTKVQFVADEFKKLCK